MSISGRVWKYGDNVDTDAIIAARYLNTSDERELAAHCLEDLDPTFASKVQPGDILVCPVAQPSWTPVFGLVKGVVTAQGGTLHHAAIIAREYGVPAVSNVFDAIGQITTGRKIRVDGTQGAVYFLDK